jgi:hypothetical protein
MRLPSTSGICSILLLASAMVALATGCDRVSEREFSGEGQGVGSPAKPEAPGPSAGEEGADCTIDGDCKGYLRCMESTCSVPPAVTGEHDSRTPRVSITTEEGRPIAEFYVELARTDPEQRRGLMFRREMQPDWGMLFVYDDQAQRSFWMENTFIALDMIFIDASGEIDSIVERAEPLTRVKRRSKGPAKYVLEVNAGRSEELGIVPGMQVEFERVDGRLPDEDNQ